MVHYMVWLDGDISIDNSSAVEARYTEAHEVGGKETMMRL